MSSENNVNKDPSTRSKFSKNLQNFIGKWRGPGSIPTDSLSAADKEKIRQEIRAQEPSYANVEVKQAPSVVSSEVAKEPEIINTSGVLNELLVAKNDSSIKAILFDLDTNALSDLELRLDHYKGRMSQEVFKNLGAKIQEMKWLQQPNEKLFSPQVVDFIKKGMIPESAINSARVDSARIEESNKSWLRAVEYYQSAETFLPSIEDPNSDQGQEEKKRQDIMLRAAFDAGKEYIGSEYAGTDIVLLFTVISESIQLQNAQTSLERAAMSTAFISGMLASVDSKRMQHPPAPAMVAVYQMIDNTELGPEQLLMGFANSSLPFELGSLFRKEKDNIKNVVQALSELQDPIYHDKDFARWMIPALDRLETSSADRASISTEKSEKEKIDDVLKSILNRPIESLPQTWDLAREEFINDLSLQGINAKDMFKTLANDPEGGKSYLLNRSTFDQMRRKKYELKRNEIAQDYLISWRKVNSGDDQNPWHKVSSPDTQNLTIDSSEFPKKYPFLTESEQKSLEEFLQEKLTWFKTQARFGYKTA